MKGSYYETSKQDVTSGAAPRSPRSRGKDLAGALEYVGAHEMGTAQYPWRLGKPSRHIFEPYIQWVLFT